MFNSFSYIQIMVNNSFFSEPFSQLIMKTNYTSGNINCSNVVLCEIFHFGHNIGFEMYKISKI